VLILVSSPHAAQPRPCCRGRAAGGG
jgi:hypothetical protein